VEEVMNFSYTK